MTIKEKERLSDPARIEAGYVLFRSIIEVLGQPAEHIEKAIREYVRSIEGDEEITVLKKEFSKAEKLETGMYSTFVEIEAWAKRMEKLFWFCFDYMPSSIEVIEPTVLKFQSREFAGFLNDLQARLHQIDMVAKTSRQEVKVHTKNTNLVVQNAVLSHLIIKPRDFSFLQKALGVPKDQMEQFMAGLERMGKVRKEGEIYHPAARPGAKGGGTDGGKDRR
ncbi:hypothetical protein JXB02_03190 [Candidatus Woesearchaeota archaeon]|nr:hypothetical protein [Candidatus Woesearchaeota archaeon]